MKKTILIICKNNLDKAPRFIMEVEALKKDYSLIAAGLNYLGSGDDFEFIQLDSFVREKGVSFHLNYPKLIRKFFSFLIKYFYYFEFSESKKFENKYNSKERKAELKKMNQLKFDLVLAHHLDSLPQAVRLSSLKNVPLLFNAHEYYPKQFENRPSWVRDTQPEYLYIANKYLPQVDQMITVCEGIKQEYKKTFGVDSELVLNSKKYYPNLKPSETDSSVIKLVHHGAAIRERHLDQMITMMDYLPSNYELTLILLPSQPTYFEELKNMAKKYDNIIFENTVDIEQIPVNINRFDIGVYILTNSSFNKEYALPNKMFEFIQARLCIAVSPNKEMKSLIESNELGVVSNDFTAKAMAAKIQEMTVADIDKYKNNSHLNAHALSSENSELTILNEVKKLIG